MKNMIEYKGYFGSVNYSDEDNIFYGKVEYIRSLISFEGNDVTSLRLNFQEAVDDYITMCEEKGIEPEKSFEGSFKVKTDSKLHRKVALKAKEQGINFDTFVSSALENYLSILENKYPTH